MQILEILNKIPSYSKQLQKETCKKLKFLLQKWNRLRNTVTPNHSLVLTDSTIDLSVERNFKLLAKYL